MGVQVILKLQCMTEQVISELRFYPMSILQAEEKG